MPEWLSTLLAQSESFMPHGHCYLWIPALLWLHVGSDLLIGTAYAGISVLLWLLVRRLRLPFSPVFVAFGLFIGLCGGTHFMEILTTWEPDYWTSGLVKAATAAASVATAIGLLLIKPRIEEFVHTARLSEERRIRLESTNAELQRLYTQVKELSDARNRFFANVSHELRTPLALILGPALRLLEDTSISTTQQRYLQSIQDNARLLARHVDDLLDVAKLESNMLQPQYVQVALAPWLQSVVQRFELGAAERRIALTVQVNAALEAQFDRDQMERVLINLLSNAMRFTPDEGRIAVAAQALDGHIEISVADSGLGVAAADRPHIFDRFRQSMSGDTTRAHGGTGLGLAIVKEFTELHGGSVQVDDSPLGGALFSLRLPRLAPPGTQLPPAQKSAAATADISAAPASAAAVSKTAEESAAGANADSTAQVVMQPRSPRPTVLVVEDSDELRRFVIEVLAQDYAVAEASDGAAGLACAEAMRPDLIISDLMMPRVDGEQLLAELARVPALAHTPVLLLSARSDDDTRIALLQSGASDYLIKPFVPAELRARVRNLVRNKRAADSLREALASASGDIETLAQDLALRSRHLQTALDAAEVARQQAERANLAKSQFLALISHELRTPLSTILLNLQMFALDKSNPLPAAVRPRAMRAAAAARQLQSTVDGLLMYVQVESGRVERRVAEVDVLQLAAETVDEFRVHVEGKPIELGLEHGGLETRVLNTDYRLLKVILANLLSNAIKFTQAGRVLVRVAADRDGVTLAVEDSGIGIAAQDLARIFEPFEQLEPIQRKSIPGVGIGLTLVRELVQELGGRIDVSSQPSQGTTFRVTLPPIPAASFVAG